jgi:hypothetical protein
MENLKKNLSDKVIAPELVTTYWVILNNTLSTGGNFFHPNLNYIGIKRILCWFQKYKLTLATKCTHKKLFQNNYFFVKIWKKPQFAMFFGITFLGAFCHQGKFIFLKST